MVRWKCITYITGSAVSESAALTAAASPLAAAAAVAAARKRCECRLLCALFDLDAFLDRRRTVMFPLEVTPARDPFSGARLWRNHARTHTMQSPTHSDIIPATAL